MPTLDEVQDGLIDLLQPKLEGIKSGLKTDKRLRRVMFDADSNRDRKDIMGKDFYYMTVLPAPPETDVLLPNELDEKGGTYKNRHGHRIRLNLKYEDAATYANSSEKAFRDLVENDPNSLMNTLRTQGYVSVDGTPVFIEQVRIEEFGFEPMEGLTVLAHAFEVFIRTVHAP